MFRILRTLLNLLQIEKSRVNLKSQTCKLHAQPLAIKKLKQKLKQNKIAATIAHLGESIEGGRVTRGNYILEVPLKRGGG